MVRVRSNLQGGGARLAPECVKKADDSLAAVCGFAGSHPCFHGKKTDGRRPETPLFLVGV